MVYERTIPFLMAPTLALSIAACVLFASGEARAATPTYYNSLATFQTDITFSVTDDYSDPEYMFIQNNAQMSAVLGETDYMSTGFANHNIVNGGYYCAGCNGSFELSFTTTTVGTGEGVVGVGMTIATHSLMTPYFAFITFADGTTENIQLPPTGSFWGVSAPERIERIHFGLSMGGTTQGGSFGIDNLIVGDGMDTTPCGDGITHEDEDCDDMGETATCDANCTFAVCGDGTFNATAGESCDDAGASPTCNSDCTMPFCGDGVVNTPAGEDCDDVGESATCNVDCTAAICGDDVVNVTAGETCDDGAQSPSCDADCTAPVCGDGIENNLAGEYCDDGNVQDDDGCSSMCTNEELGGSTSDGGGSSSETGAADGTADSSTDDGTSAGTSGTDGESSGGGMGETSEGEGGSASASASDDSGSASASATASASDTGESLGAGSDGAADESGGGCGCTTDRDPRDAGGGVLALFGLAALTRRRRAS